jgi:NAD(P)-dependent dehydrogenase (short-subunit alcohol dehydrogenase family)
MYEPGSGPYPCGPCAAASRDCTARRLLSKVAAIECQDARNGVRVYVVTPGGVKTPMWGAMDFFRDLVAAHGGTEEAFAAMAGEAPSRQFFPAEEVARTIPYLASEESAHLSGVELILDRGHTG